MGLNQDLQTAIIEAVYLAQVNLLRRAGVSEFNLRRSSCLIRTLLFSGHVTRTPVHYLTGAPF